MEDQAIYKTYQPMESVVFNHNQGSGYITDSEIIDPSFKPDAAEFVFGTIQSGELTNMGHFFNKPLKYMGRKGGELVFLIGNELKPQKIKWFFQSVYLISPTRIFLMYSHASGRDYNWVNGQWK